MDYLHVVQHLTLEADLTRFGGSAISNAPEMGYGGYSKVEGLITAIVSGLSKQWSIAELNLMCRRYVGSRPNSKTLNAPESKCLCLFRPSPHLKTTVTDRSLNSSLLPRKGHLHIRFCY
jgi:hypothetical protein